MSSLVRKQTYQTAVQPNRERQTVKQRVYKGGISKGEKLTYVVAAAALVFTLYFLLSNYASIYMTNHEIIKTETVIQEQGSVNEGLSLQVMELSDPERILSKAKDMGMILNEDNVKFTHNSE